MPRVLPAIWLLATIGAGTAAGAVVVLDRASGRVLYREGAVREGSAPGSVIKPFVLAALEQQRKSSVDERHPCARRLRIGTRNFDCVHGDAGHPLDGREAVAYSCNSWFATAARTLSADDLAAGLTQFGLRTPVRALTPEQLQMQMLGSYGLSVTPLELARAYRSLASSATPAVSGGLAAAADYGTARLAGIQGMLVRGKTGTNSAGQAWFAGYTGDLIVVVRLAAGSGGGDAAPVAARYFRRYGHPSVTFRVRTGGAVERLTTEEYAARVLAGEAGNFRSEEALKAMAVVIRSYARQNRGRHRAGGFDFCDTTHCQALSKQPAAPSIKAAVTATEGEILWYEGRPARVFYHQHCGGATESAGRLWAGEDRPYLRGIGDGFCTQVSARPWQAEISTADLMQAIGVPAQSTLTVLERSPSGRVLKLSAGSRRFTSEQFHVLVGRSLGWQYLKSSWYQMRPTATGYRFEGKGGGHGVGLCQTGASARGRAGHGYKEILAAYFPQTQPATSAPGPTWQPRPGERVTVLSLGGAGDEEVLPVADRLLKEAEQRTGLAAACRPEIYLYPTVAAFRDATGQPGSTAAVARQCAIRMQPVAVLRSHTSFNDVLLHELIHVVLSGHSGKDIPEWFEEGLALSLAGAPANQRMRYAEAKQRVDRLLTQHGREQLLAWLRTGLPDGVR